MKCLLLHKWNGCKCIKCGKTRDVGHVFDETLTCTICGTKKKIKKTAGTCCICGRALYRNPNDSKKLDDAARFCPNCGTDICVYCMGKFSSGAFLTCPVCGEKKIFEINPQFRPR